MTQSTTVQPKNELRLKRFAGIPDFLLVCGIVAPLLYIGSDIAAAARFAGYSYADQTISELMAIGAPTRPFLITLFVPWNLLVMAFGAGAWASAGQKRAQRVAGILLLAYGCVSLAGLFSPMHLRGGAGSATDVMHILLTMGIVLFALLYIGFGAFTSGKWFRLYSIVTIVIMLVFGGLAGSEGARIAANLPTPWVGVFERVSVYSSMLWMLAFALMLLRREKTRD